jgi:thiamine transport system substrate-binding protein
MSVSIWAATPLTVYTYSSFTSDWGPGPKLKALFEKECDCTLEWVGLDDGVSILNRLKLEGGNTKADVILGLDTNLMPETRALQLTALHQLEFENLSLPGGWQEQDFVPFDHGYFAFIYDRQKMVTPPRSMAALLNDFDGRIVYQDPRTSTPGQGLMLWIKSLYGDKADAAWRKLKPKTVTVTKGWSEAYGMFLKGEADLVLSYTTSPAYHMVAEQESRYQAAEFSEGHYQQIEVAAMTKTSRQPDLARQFLKFLVSKPAQELIAVTNWMLPVRSDAKLPEAFNTLIQPKPLAIEPANVAKNRKNWTSEWREAVSF